MKRAIIYSLQILLLLYTSACRQPEGNTSDKEIKCYTLEEVHGLMLGITQEYLNTQAGVNLSLQKMSGEDMITVLDQKLPNVIVVCDDTMPLSGRGFEFVLLASQAVITVFNSDNPYIQHLARYGAGPHQISAIFSGALNDWKAFGEDLGPEPINLCWLSPIHSESKKFTAFFGVEYPAVTGFADRGAMVKTLSSDPNALGYLYSSDVFDPATGFRKSALYILPLDQDSSGFLDDAEQIYDELSMFETAVHRGQYPAALVTTYYMAVPLEGRNDAINGFLDWFKAERQAIRARYSFLSP